MVSYGRRAGGFADTQSNLGVHVLHRRRRSPKRHRGSAMVSHGRRAGACHDAQFNLGIMYDNGRGVPKIGTEAARWYRMATEQGFADAQFNLGVMYYTGEGIPKDYVQAYAWLNIAAAQGDESAKENLEIITKEMTTAEITKAQELSREYWKAYGPNRASSE